jgi:hypothetical protein
MVSYKTTINQPLVNARRPGILFITNFCIFEMEDLEAWQDTYLNR